ncbi:hypothetical protein ABB37_06378 [Leptomonas pyrrhocoris]|uniref:Temperature dependent protein affecting M2 dsRNA replication n=1 Tax=Leptomonas pyrrhocoris TaxID=157538 RepID=A0A0M9FXY3_LEPPY|nr:hypothetical protein ABB37_06378 [Leptomonas pyrrhocoris]KPA78217.1 hypothetical protein ABB37_06378 [Leptomonas pyrrhocoris]|eukprot:XP_015656656.1 hypothetical protein ABB37_06378 [Leptomonas pyrrhocoris]
MPPRTHRGGVQGPQPPPPPQQQQQLPPPPQQQQQGGYGNAAGPPAHLHMFHQHTHGGYMDSGRGPIMGPPQHGGGGNNGSNMSNNGMMYGGGGGGGGGGSGNTPTSPMYGGGGPGYGNSGAPAHMMPPPSPHPQQQQQMGGMGYNPNMRGSAPPPPPHMEPSPSFMGGPPQPLQGMMRDNSYGLDMDNSPPPPNSGYRGGSQHNMQMQSPPVQQQQQQHYQGNSSYGSGNRGAGMQGQNMQMPLPPQQQQQQMMGVGGPNSANRGMGGGGGPMGGGKQLQQQQQGPPQQGMLPPPQGGGNNNWGPPQSLAPPHMQANVSPKPQGPPPMGGGGGMQYGGGGGGGGTPGPMMGRGRGGNRMGPGGMGPGPMGNMGAPPPPPMQQRQPPQPQGMMGGGGPPSMPNNGMNPNMMMLPPSPGVPMMGPGGESPGMYPPNPDPGMGGMDPGMMGGMAMPQIQRGYMDVDPPGDLAPQQTLYEFLMEKRLLRKTTLNTFFPANYDPKKDGPYTIAVDGNYMITNLRAQLQRTDPLWFLHSCLPDCLLSLVHKHVEEMRAHHLEPFWVLNGIGINGDVEAFLASPDELCARDAVWEKLNEGIETLTQEEITEAFETSSSIGEDVMRAIQRFLRTEENVVCVTAPFLNWCQMVTLHKEGVAQLLMGPPEMLMVPYDDMKCIAEVNLQTSEVAYYDRDEVLRELFPHYVTDTSTAAAGDRFMDLGLLIASHPAITTAHASVQLSTQSIYEELSTSHPHFVCLHDFIDRYELQPNQNERPNLEKLKHSKGRTYIQYSPVFSSQVTSESSLMYFIRILDPTLKNKDMPNNLSGVFGYHVPLSLFYFQFTGLLSVSLMTAITQLYIRDEFPVADTEEYHNLLHPLMALRGQIISQVVSRIKVDPNGQRVGKISWVRWFDSILMNVLPPDRLIVLDEWNLSEATELAEVPDDQLENIDMAMVLSLKSSAMCVQAPQLPPTMPPRDAPILYHGRKETFFAILLKTFDFVGYFSHSMDAKESGEASAEPLAAMVQGQMNPDDQGSSNQGMGQDDMGDDMNGEDGALPEQKVFFTAYLSISLEHCPQEFQCALVRFTELLRVTAINSNPFTFADSMQKEEDEVEADPPEVLLTTRIACLVSIPYQEQAGEEDTFEWAPVYSRQLCAFTVMSRVMNRSLRVLTEAIAAAQFLTGFSDCSLEDYESMSTLLPFGDVPSSLGGLLLHYVLVFPPDYEANCQTPEERCRLLETKFKAIPNLQTQLRRVMEFTFHALYLLNVYIVKDPSIVRSPELVETDVVSNALNLLHEKWEQHLDGPAPEDVHGFYRFE